MNGYYLKDLKIELTQECLMECAHCSSNAARDTLCHISYARCKRIIKEASEMGVEKITFSGGEPFLAEYLELAIDQTNKSGIKCSVYSSGYVKNFSEKLKAAKNAGLSKIVFSIHGASAMVHDSITRTVGSFNAMKDAALSAKALGVCVEFHFVPFVSNYKLLPQIAGIAQQLGGESLSLLRFVPQGRGEKFFDQILKRGDWCNLKEMILEQRSNGFALRTGSPLNFLCLGTPTTCMAGIDRLTILPNLKIVPCDAFKGSFENLCSPEDDNSDLNMVPLKECWENSKVLKSIRRYHQYHIGSECNGCPDYDKCESGCMGQKLARNEGLVSMYDCDCLRYSN